MPSAAIFEQRVIGPLTPKEERKARCEFQIAQWKRAAIAVLACGRSNRTIEKVGIDQHCRHRLFDTHIKSARSFCVPAGFEIRHQGIDVVLCDGSTERAAGKVLDNGARAGLDFTRRCAGLAAGK